MAPMLAFHRAIVEDLCGEEGRESHHAASASGSALVVLGEGLGLSRVVSQLLERQLAHDRDRNEGAGRGKHHAAGGHGNKLTILIGFSEYQRRCILSDLAREEKKRGALRRSVLDEE